MGDGLIFIEVVDETDLSVMSGLDALVNNAGVMSTPTLEQLTEEEFNNTMDINLKSAVMMTKLAGFLTMDTFFI